MGVAGCKPCEEDTSTNSQITPIAGLATDEVVPKAGKFFSGKLEGKWLRQGDNVLLGEIKDEKMLWEQIYQHGPSVLSAVNEKTIALNLEGDRHEGAVYGEGEKITWSDGEVW
eukprot:CAMPEP_0197648664 /NCGR_PEP_ID=MMETSP1338-20131121/27894_1 /TAXON_ID=43686 ORGANISM="Pelagodinium beii, Strain RCC1491" /NCGR_SAMPLE_ID=MMETSP1338 /ASSEMBLY_ACC=CAM_ASM_000754 /LENGTH=112 /DNA_ID=CAMNT_0043222711 /DNA_START=49 /DNA_END=384 /DNA_ORIENTATION=+